MWNSGSEVISRSSGPSSIHHGNPSPAMAYARWVCMTSLDRPVVPEVGISTARSDAPTRWSSAVSGAGGCRQPPTTSSTRRHTKGGEASAAVATTGMSSSSETTRRGRA